MWRLSPDRLALLVCATYIILLLACERTVTSPERLPPPFGVTKHEATCPTQVPCDTRPFDPAEAQFVYDNLTEHYSYGLDPTCDGILDKAYDRLGASMVSYWTNAPRNYSGDSHSLYQNIHITQWAMANGMEAGKTMFHEAAHLWFGAATHESTIYFWEDACFH